MPIAHSNDLRQSVINAIERGEKASKIVEIFGVEKSSVYDWKKKLKCVTIHRQLVLRNIIYN